MEVNRCSLGLGALRPDQLREAFKFGKDYFLRTSRPDEKWSGSGVVIVGGGKYLQWTLNNVRNCKRFSGLPVQVWSLNSREIPDPEVFRDMGVCVVNAADVLQQNPMRRFSGWGCKMFAALHCPFQNVMVLDADCLATSAGMALFSHPTFVEKGALFCQDIRRCHGSDLPYFCASIQPPRFLQPPQQEFETGAFIVDKYKQHPAIRMAVWLSEHSDGWWTPLMHGDKGTTELAWRGLKLPFGLLESKWWDWGIAHGLDGQMRFAHALGVKRGKAQMPVLT